MNKWQEALDEMCCGCYASCSKDGKPCLAYMKLQELVDKSIPKKVKKKIKAVSPIHDIVIGTCLNCGEEDLKENCNYCSNCGQKLKWE